MTWSMSWSRNNSLCSSFCAWLLAALLLGIPGSASAQESFDQRFQDAENLVQSGKPGSIEEACNAFKLLDKEKPGDKQVQAFLRASCNSFNNLQKKEDDLFNEGVQLFSQGQLSDAKQRFEQSGRLTGLKTFRHKDEALKYIGQIDAQVKVQGAFQGCIKLFGDGKYHEAQSCFSQVAEGGGPRAADARNYLAKIKEAVGKQQAEEEMANTLQQGKRLYNAGNNAEAYSAFSKVAQAGGPNATEAKNYLRRIAEAQKKAAQKERPGGGEVAKVNPPPPPNKRTGGTEQPTATDETLRAGLKAYFAGDLQEAQRDLKDYIEHNGQKKGLAYFFRGAAHSTLYFLSGEKDSGEKSQAVADFQAAKSSGQGFSPPSEKYVSPKILDIYNQVPGQ
jgi:hypothetical protein